jgi:uncharacterized protein YecE (DUF72 family)
MMQNPRIRVGTSGWHYNHWKGSFYPEGTSSAAMLDYYVQHFDTVEINNSFYQLPRPETLQQWRSCTPPDFVFAFKASRYITHMKKLKEPAESLQKMLQAAGELGSKLGPILFQLPPRWRVNPDRLKQFLDALPDGHRYTFEFRDPSWFDDRIYTILASRNAAFCQYQLEGRLSPKAITADFVYIRLHGPAEQAYQGSYDVQTLAGWAGALTAWRRQEKTVYCYFDNDQAGYAAQNALQLQEMVLEPNRREDKTA